MDNYDPRIVAKLRAFFAAMRAWELVCTERDRRERKERWTDSASDLAYEAEVRELEAIFREHCTSWETPFRTGTFAIGAEYDPDGEKILSVEQEGDTATVYTQQTTSSPNRRYAYKLKMTTDGWRLLDERYIVDDNGLEPWFL